MRRTFITWLSRSWRPHSELIQGWIAGAASESRQLQQARAYMHDLQLQDVLTDVDDAVELVYLMHRSAYPAGSHLEARAGEFLAESAVLVTSAQLLEIGRRLKEQPASGPLWSRVVFENAWFTNRAAELLGGLTLEEHLTFCAAYWRAVLTAPSHPSSLTPASAAGSTTTTVTTTSAGVASPPTSLASTASRHAVRGAAVAVSQKLASLTAQRIGRCSEDDNDNTGWAVCLCVQLEIPLHNESLAELRQLLLSCTRNSLSAVQVLEVAEALASQRTADAVWVDALQAAMCRQSPGSINVPHVIGLLRAMAVVRLTPPSAELEQLLLSLLPAMSADATLDCCCSLAAMPGTAYRLRAELQRVLASPSKAQLQGVDDVLLWKLRGMSLIAPEEARALLSGLVERIKETEKMLSPAAVKSVVRCMSELRVFPPELVSRCMASFLQGALPSFTQEDAVWVMYAAAHAGEPVDGVFFKEALHRFAATRKFDRRKHGANHRSTLSIETVSMLLEALSIAKGGRLSSDSKVYAVVREAVERQQQRQEGMTVGERIHIVKLLVQLEVNDASLKTALLTGVSKSIATLTAVQVEELCDVLVALKSRDILMFRALLAHLAQAQPDRESITSIASAAKKLKFTPYFQQSQLVTHITSLEGWSVSDIVLVASVCNEKQRLALLALPGAEVLAQALPDELTTLDLFLLLAITDGGEAHVSAIAAALKSRPPLAAEELEVEDVWRAFVNVVRDKEALAAVCRCAAATVQRADENTLMRLLEAATASPELPNIFFRVVGKAVLRLASSMAVENASRWLQLYVKNKIRDDSVGKALLTRVRTRSNNAATTVDKTLREAAVMYGKSYTLQPKLKKTQDKVEWYTHRTV
ncbi:hypothetical protein DQ04_02221080 [Trypanosoma grayi]|uniref:hypothetical protein n=1 Tax=Trypanosoma grayi TaxID=71804 RepID=UPI0004F491ED|nr:hypothetical protein DQ04_02221080 [Trypanosoma grayi]KEG11846.1 hypothetical protein DQ04_02221080 [Trypanosoma grayi]